MERKQTVKKYTATHRDKKGSKKASAAKEAGAKKETRRSTKPKKELSRAQKIAMQDHSNWVSFEQDREPVEKVEIPDDMTKSEGRIEGRNAVTEAFRSGKTIDRLYILDGCTDGAILTIKRMAAKNNVPIKYVSRQRLDQMSETGDKHQGVIAVVAAYHYAEIDDLFAVAQSRNEDPFFIILDRIEDPGNLGAIIRTANVVGAHGVIIPKDRAVGLTATVAKASAGAINYTPVVKVTNIAKTIEELKERGLWFVCADMDGTPMTKLNLTGPIGMVIGAEGEGVSRLVREKCDIIAGIPQKGQINSLNASVAAGVLAYEIQRQRDLHANK